MTDAPPRQAIILAAGFGRRLEEARTRPKALVEIHGRSILERALTALEGHGTREVAIVIGHHGAQIADYVAARTGSARIALVWNHEFATTDSAYSLWCARQWLDAGAIVMNGDVVVADRALHAAISARREQSLWLGTRAQPGDDGWMLALGPDRRVLELEVVRHPAAGIGAHLFKSAGVLSFSARDGRSLASWLDHAVQNGHIDCHFDEILRRHLVEIVLEGAEIERSSWAEIDHAADLQRARQVFAPEARRGPDGTRT